MPVTKEQKEEAKAYVELIKKSKGSLKVYFAVGKGPDGDAVHIDKKKPNACVSALKAKKVGTMLASGQVKFEDALTLCCMKEPNENAVKKAFFHFFKDHEASIPGVTESKIVVLGPKDWDSSAEDEGATQSASAQTPAAGQPAAATPSPDAPAESTVPPSGPNQDGPALLEAYKKLVPEMNEKVAAKPELKDALTKAARLFQEQLHATELGKAAKTLEQLAELLHSPVDAAAKPDPKELVAAYQKLVPEMSKKVAEAPTLKLPLTAAAKQFQGALQAGKFDVAQRALDEIAAHLASKPQTPKSDGPKTADLAREFTTRYDALKPELMHAIQEGRGDVSKMRAGTQFTIEKANQKDFATALKALDQLERLVKAAAPAERKAAPDGPVARGKALHNFQAARRVVAAQLAALNDAMQKAAPEEADLAQETHDYLNELADEIAEAVRDAIDAPGTTDVKAMIERYAAELNSHELVDLVDANPLVKVSVRETLTQALTELRQTMPATA